MNLPPFAVNFDYRCPFARNIHLHLIAALRAGATFDVAFEPFTLTQGHVPPGEPAVWDDPARRSDLLALEVGLAARDLTPGDFLDIHETLFVARHELGNPLRTREQIESVLAAIPVDLDDLFDYVDGGTPRTEIAERWTTRTSTQEVFGVPTFFVGDHAVFVRHMSRPSNDVDSVALIEKIVTLIDADPGLNEFKHTTVPN